MNDTPNPSSQQVAHAHHEFTPNLRYTVETSMDGGVIQQNLHDASHRISRWVMNTRDAQMRAALIRLGWTPPVPS